ncbi:MAG TPA: hypothetical protein VMX17_11505 [Candidatus Glassbacteria bacterium]|nr:hypothetical protein [Candidatus Glassbacteria bacterium]
MKRYFLKTEWMKNKHLHPLLINEEFVDGYIEVTKEQYMQAQSIATPDPKYGEETAFSSFSGRGIQGKIQNN